MIAAHDYGWVVPLVTEPSLANAHRRLRREGVPADQPARAIRLIERMLEREGSLTRPEIAERLRRRGIRTEGQAIAHLVWLAAAHGLICHGPDRERDQTFVLVRDWVGEPKRMEHEASLTELAVRYLTGHGPGEPADLAFWSGITLRSAKGAWTSIGDRLEEVETQRGVRWSLRSQTERAHRGVVRLLPSFDEYLLGWKDRASLVSAKDWKMVNRGGGWLHPVIVVDGRVIGTWRTDRSPMGLRLHLSPFSTVSSSIRRQVALETEDLARFQSIQVDPVWD